MVNHAFATPTENEPGKSSNPRGAGDLREPPQTGPNVRSRNETGNELSETESNSAAPRRSNHGPDRPTRTGFLVLGAGRPQVQILSPRFEKSPAKRHYSEDGAGERSGRLPGTNFLVCGPSGGHASRLVHRVQGEAAVRLAEGQDARVMLLANFRCGLRSGSRPAFAWSRCFV
jgi:hypothetical protein